jgi:hypothetical protein
MASCSLSGGAPRLSCFDDGRVKTASYDAAEGFGLRAVKGDVAGYAHSTEISEAALKRASETARLAVGDGGGTLADGPAGTNAKLYTDADPMADATFAVKLDTLREIDDFARALDPARGAGQRLACRQPPGGRSSCARKARGVGYPAHGAAERQRHRRGERPPRIGQRRRRRADRSDRPAGAWRIGRTLRARRCGSPW